ncbi:unnamed protein product [Dibothriocephalus latus]|uniref:Uncharacterized protein n=1 Tax=Dibothriocephalus latus TaxID=60516 RepID=A0A3P7LV62_DIBLA|nr:unnamed protein product [Dibothriocephalus latus]
MQEHMPPACYCCNGSYDDQQQGCKEEGSEGRAALVQIAESMEKGSKESLIIQCAEDNHEGRGDVNNDNSNQISTNGHRHSASEDIV